MKILLDFLPIVLFFISYKWGHAHPEAAQAWVQTLLGPLAHWVNQNNTSTSAAINAGQTAGTQAAILLATLVAMISTSLQIALQKILGRRVEAAQWLGLGLIVVFGGATVVLQNEAFIKWKPTLLYAIMAAALVIARVGFGVNVVQRMMNNHIVLPTRIWTHILWLWFSFFITMAILNAWVLQYFSTDTWVEFKLYGTLGATLVFVLGQGLYMSRHLTNAKNSNQQTDHNGS